MALPPPFVTGADAGLAAGGALQTELTSRLASSRLKDSFSHMGIALVDLTNIGAGASSTSVAFAGNARLETQVAVGSLSKIAIMFAAFSLRACVTRAAAGVASTATDVDDMVAKITADWNPIVSKKIRKPPADFPDLKRIFDFAGASPWTPSFKGSTRDWAQLAPFHETSAAAISVLPFMDRLRLAIRFSDNMGSGACARDMGFQFMNGSLGESGFADNRRNGFLWLGGDFGFAPKTLIMGAPPWDTSANATWVRASARGIASYLTLLWTNRLVDGPSSGEMREILLDRAGIGFGTFIGNATPGRRKSWSKVGILTGSISEGVIIEAAAGSGLIRYAAIGLAATREEVLKELAKIFHATVAAVHSAP